jgi:hypothetical protein
MVVGSLPDAWAARSRFCADATAFLRQVESGANTSEAFEQSFGIPVSKLHNSLVQYGLTDLRVIRLTNQDLPVVPTNVSPVAANVIAGELGLLVWQFGNVEEAKRLWEAARTLNPTKTLALVGLGTAKNAPVVSRRRKRTTRRH